MMNDHTFKELYPQRHNIRLRRYDYALPGAYFVTICTYHKQSLFGDVVDSAMKLNHYGEIVESVWKNIPLHYPEVNNEVSTVMPNHIHGIIIIQDLKRAGPRPAPTEKQLLSEIRKNW